MVRASSGDEVHLAKGDIKALMGLCFTIVLTLVGGAWQMSREATGLRIEVTSLRQELTELKGMRSEVSAIQIRMERLETKLSRWSP